MLFIQYCGIVFILIELVILKCIATFISIKRCVKTRKSKKTLMVLLSCYDCCIEILLSQETSKDIFIK